MDDEKRRSRSRSRSLSRQHSRSSRSISRTRSRRYQSRRHSVSRSRSVDRRHRRNRSGDRRKHRSRSRSHSRSRTHRKKSKHSHSHRRSRSRSSSRSRSRHTNRSAKHDKVSNKAGNRDVTNLPVDTKFCKDKSRTPDRRETYENSNDGSNYTNDSPYSNYNIDNDEPIDKERIHREIEQKLRETLAREGKVYPPKKAEASHPVFANDGSFLEIFKKIQEQQSTATHPVGLANLPPQVVCASSSTAAYVSATATGTTAPPPPIVGRRRGGKILKTGVVAKQRINADGTNADPKDFWSFYLADVHKYKNTACESETGNRPLVK